MVLRFVERFRKISLDMVLILVLCLLSFGLTNQLSNKDFLNERLQSAALHVISLHSHSLPNDINEVLPQHSDESGSRRQRSVPSFFNIPTLDNSSNLMHSYISDTGVGNREDLLIEYTRQEKLEVVVPSLMIGWKDVRFNSTDFVMAYQDFHLNIWRMHVTADIREQGLRFDHRNAYCSVDLRSEGQIIDAMFYTKFIKYSEVLLFAVTLQTAKGFQLRSYEVTFGECISTLHKDLHQSRPLRIGLLSSQYENALVLLFEGNVIKTQVKYSHKSQDESTKLIEVYARGAKTLETLTINGFGYITVANVLGCEIFRMNEFLSHETPFDTIEIPDIIDIKAFRLGFNYFLGLATRSNRQYLYVWYSGAFNLKQIFAVDAVLKWNAIYLPTCRDDVLIYFIRKGLPELIYRWNGQQREFQLANKEANEQLSHNYQVLPYSLSHFSYNHTAYVFQVDQNRRPHLVSIETRLEVVADPEILRGHKISEMMNNMKERFVFQQTYLQKISDALKYAIRPKANHLVLIPHLIRNLTVLNGITVNHIKSLSHTFWQNSKLGVSDLKYGLKDLINTIKAIETQIARIFLTTNDIVLKNKPSIITGHKNFFGNNQISLLNTTTAVVGFVGRQDLRQVLSDLYRRKRPQIVRGVKQIVRPTFVKQSLNSGLINGVDFIKQIVTTNNPQTIKSLIYFVSQLSVVNHLTIRGKLNNIDINKDLVFLNRDEVIPVPKVLTSPLVIAQRVNALIIDGINLTELSRNTLTTDGLKQKVNKKLFLLRPLTTNNIIVEGIVNNIDISMMATQLVYKNRPSIVRGKKTFILDDFYIKNHLFVRNKIDGRKVPDDLMLRNRNEIITAPKIFQESTRFEGNVVIKGFIDGLRLPQDIITLTRNETIIGPIVFSQSLIANQNIDARRLVDGVDLSELQLYSLKMNDKLIQSDVHFQKPVSVGFVELNGKVNGIDLRKVFNEAIFKGSPSVEISGTKFFDLHIQMKELYAERVNGIDLNDLLSTHKNETIFAPKVFTSLTQFNSIDVNGLIGRVNLTNLYRSRVSLSKSETIYGVKNFINEIIVSNGININKINGLVPQIDFVIKSKPQLINGHKIFVKPLNANKVIAKTPTLVKGRIDGIFLNHLNSRVIRLNSYLTTPLNIVLLNSNSSFVEVFKGLNGLNISDFANNMMSLTTPQTVYSPKHFQNVQTFTRITSLKGISGISLTYLKQNAVYLNGLTRISDSFTFTHPVTFEKPLTVLGVVNGVNLSYLANDAVYKVGHKLITGKNTFKSGFRVNGDIHCFNFNGIDLSNELITKTRDHIIKGKVKFVKTLNVNGNILLNGLINGLKLSELSARIMKTNDRNLINGNLELIGHTRVLTNLIIRGRLNGINLTQLFNNAVFLNSNQNIGGSKILNAPIHMLSNLNTSNLNDINIHQMLEDIVYINSVAEQHIIVPKVFTNDIKSNDLIQTNGIAFMGPINGVNLIQLDSESIKTNRPTHLKLIRNFKDFTVITNNFTQIFGRINGIDLNKDVINVNINNRGPQLITGNKVFEHLVLNDNVLIDGLVNGFALKPIELSTFFTTNDQRIIGHRIIKPLLELSADNNFVGTLNNLRIPEDLVTLNGNQTVFGPLVFNNPLFVNRNIFVTGSVSGINVTKLAAESLVKDRPQVIGQPIKFDTIVFRQDVKVDQSVDNVDLSALSNTVKQFTSVVNVSKELLELKASRHHYISDYLFKSLQKSLFEIDSFNLYQSLYEIHGNNIQVLSDGVFTLSESIENPKNVHLIRFNPKTELFDSSLINENPLITKKEFILSGEHFVINWSPYSHNFSSHITKSGQLIATIASFVNFVEVLKTSKNSVILISFQSNTGKLMVHSFEALPNKGYSFTQITEAFVGTDTSKVIGFLNANIVYIVVTKQFRLNCISDKTGSLVFVLRNYRTLELIQKLEIMNVVDVVHFENNGKHYLALSDGTPVESSMSPQTIYIYRSNAITKKCSFSLFQKLYFDNVLQLSAFSFGTVHLQEQYLVITNSSIVSIWKQSGESGFVENWLLQTKSARVVSPIIADHNLYLIIGQRYRCHESLIFKAEYSGIAIEALILTTQ